MPSRRKTSMFASAFCTCVSSFVVICVVLATPQWVSSDVRFSRTNSTVTVSLTYGLFSGTCEQFVDAGLLVSEKTFQVADALSSARSRSLNVAIIVVLVLALLSSLLSSGFTCTNAVSNPYQTFLGPVGVYTWNSVCGVLTLIAMILFPVNVQGNSLSQELAQGCSTSPQTHLGSKHNYGYSYWIMLLILFLNIASLVIIYFYDHARYSKKKEQERPIENAPKDVILF
ncbi:clarin-3 [Corvus cornix cornix]|nr:clarin-3 [Corvus cornix cornix]XP_031972876.1 clarin-3 [Corvus moneduloides]XP_041875511.1 clarin-3 [Corvus kubaryi]XP_048168042.1 clarin-3 [Corvus hawaiiensis]NXD57256.1 CLRN3 protein [Corvus moneduloides]